jgi:tRNA (guanine-N7-)-methyltransferase
MPTAPSSAELRSDDPSSKEHQTLIVERREQLGKTLAPVLPPGASFVWEVGCGHGHFLTSYAAAHPSALCIGIDIASDRVGRGLRKRSRSGLGNLHFLHADATDFLAALPANATIAAAYVLFPDPWPKRRHQKHRLLNPEFLDRLGHHMGQGSRLYFRTDFEPYFIDTQQLLGARSDWRLTDDPWPFEASTVFQERAATYRSLIAVRR